MKFSRKIIVLATLVILILSSVSATSVFLTSDHIGSEDNDKKMLSEIKDFIEELSDKSITVIIDSDAPSPGEGTRAVESDADVVVNFAAVDCGNFQVLAHGSVDSLKQYIFVNTGNLNLDNTTSIRRAWDDNYSSSSFAGIKSPAKFLNDAGIDYIQPLVKYPDKSVNGIYAKSDSYVNKYIAQQIIDDINKYSNSDKKYDESLIITHTLKPSSMATASHEYLLESSNSTSDLNKTYNSFTAPQVLYLTASYLNGSSLEIPNSYEAPDDPMDGSTFTKDTYSYYDYVAMAKETLNYMDDNGKAPDYIKYEGAKIGYYDLLYNFAKITQNHTTTSEMDFAREYHFTTNSDILTSLLPYLCGGIVVLTILYTVSKMFRRRKY